MKTLTLTNWIFSLALIVSLSACQSMPTHQAYPGEKKPDAETVTLVVPKQFNLLFIDGQTYSQSFLQDGVIVKMLPGKHSLVINYLDIWDINADEHDKIRSEPFMLTFSVNAGQQYKISMRALDSVEEARAYAKNPTVEVVDASGSAVQPLELAFKLEQQDYLASFKSPAASEKPAAPTAAGSRAVEMLQYWWQQASEEEQQAFQEWAQTRQ